MAHDAVHADHRAQAARPQFEGEIDVLAAVLKRRVKTSQGKEVGAAHEAAGGRGRENRAQAAGAPGQHAHVGDLAGVVDGDAGMINGAVGNPELDVAHEADPGPHQRGEHRRKPSRREHEVVVEQREHIAAGLMRAAVAAGGEAEIPLV